MSTPIDPSYRPGFNNCNEVNALCPVEASTYGEFFNLGGCIFFTVFYAIALIWTTYIGIKGRTWTFSTFLAIGIILELMGYAARIAMTPIGTVWNYSAFVIQLVMLIIGPTLVAAAISVTFKWIVIQKGVKYSLLRPNLYPWFFVGLDFFSIVIQAIGGAISATATGGETNAKLLDVGSDLLVAGVAFQAANMAFCGMFMVVYWWRYRRASKRGELEPPKDTTPVNGDIPSGSTSPDQTQARPETTRQESRFKLFIWALLIAYIAVLIRCIYRIPEMALGWGSTLMQNETLFLILDGAMVAIAVLALSVFHPAIYFPILSKPKRSAKTQTTTSKRRSLFRQEKTTETEEK